ncbi:MAG TPA: peptidoglycan DD-metalloendopeptidase family protein [Verrucomicrobiae bacterium]|nr:peptidoglycan DD-metalloendopeptidase family protein [Verrucomicrobiae bacterium]
MRPRPHRSATASIRSGAHRISRTERVADRLIALISPRLDRLVARVGGRERVLPIGIAILVLIASVSSVAVSGTAIGATGSTSGAGAGPRLTIGGIDAGTDSINGPDQAGYLSGVGSTTVASGPLDLGQYLSDGTLLKPLAVDTAVSDASAKLVTYTVKSGDTLTGIAKHFGISMMTLWWANDLAAKDVLHIGQKLEIPPVDGLVIVVKAGDTLDSISALTGMSADQIVAYNSLTDRTLVLGQVLIVPDARGKPIAVPAAPRPVAVRRTTSSSGTARPPTSYSGGTFAWPVPGGYISQYFHASHPAIDIAAPEGTRVLAAAAGTVIWAGWKDNGGGYQVWIAHGSGLFTTYNHMSAVLVSIGQHVGRSQQVGRVGMTGNATGPHCHFEVWKGMVWGDGVRVNPLPYF